MAFRYGKRLGRYASVQRAIRSAPDDREISNGKNQRCLGTDAERESAIPRGADYRVVNIRFARRKALTAPYSGNSDEGRRMADHSPTLDVVARRQRKRARSRPRSLTSSMRGKW